ncbi:hypothetical protein D3C72_1791890 [compost metagenome]
MDLGDDGHGQGLQTLHDPAALAEQGAVVVQGRLTAHFAQVMARAKCPARGLQHHATHIGFTGQGINFLLQGGQQTFGQCVELRGPVQAQRHDAACRSAQQQRLQRCFVIQGIGIRGHVVPRKGFPGY